MPYNLNDYQYSGNVSSGLNYPKGISFSDDGAYLFIAYNNQVEQHSLPTPWDVASTTYVRELPKRESTADIRGMCLSVDGTKLYVYEYTGISEGSVNAINEYTLSTPWNLSTALYIHQWEVDGDMWINGIFISTNGDKLYTATTYGSPDKILEFTLSTPWDITSSESRIDFIQGEESDGTIYSCMLSWDGLNMYIAGKEQGGSYDMVLQYGLSVAWDVATAEYLFTIPPEESSVRHMFFNYNGDKFYESYSEISRLEYHPTIYFDFVQSVELPTNHYFDLTQTLAPFDLHSFVFTQSIQEIESVKYFNFIQSIEKEPQSTITQSTIIQRVNI